LETDSVELVIEADLEIEEVDGEPEPPASPQRRLPAPATLRPASDNLTVRADLSKLAEVQANKPKPPPPKSSAGRKASLPPPKRGAPKPAVAPPTAAAKSEDDDPRVARGRSIIEACEHELRRTKDDVQLARLHHEIGLAYEMLVGRTSGALEHYHLAIAKSPDLIPAIRGVRRLSIAASRRAGTSADKKAVDEALRMFDAELAVVSEPAVVAALYYEKGRLEASRGGLHLQAARRSLGRALEVEPHHLGALETSLRVCREANDDRGIDETYEKLASALEDDPRGRAAVLAARARHVEVKLNDADRAVELYERALQLDADAGGVQAALERILYAKKRWRELVTVLMRRVERAGDPRRAATALVEVATIQSEQLGDEDEAIASLVRASELAPADGLILDELARRHEARGETRPLASVLARRAELLEQPRERLGLLHRLGTLHERLRDHDGAIHWYARALDVDAAYVPSLRALGKLYSSKERYKDLVRMHLGAADAFTEQARKADAHARAAEIMEVHLHRGTSAIEHHARALALMPDLDGSFKALVRLYAAGRQHRELIDLYERAFDRAPHQDQKVTYLFKIAALQEDALADPGAAVGTYARVLELDARNLGAIHGSQRTAEAAEDWRGLVSALEREVELVPPADGARKVALLHRAGSIFDERLDDEAAALDRLRKAQSIDAKHPRVLASLGRLFHRRGRWKELFDVFGRELELAETTNEQVELAAKMGELAERELHDETVALERYRFAVGLDPRHRPSLAAMARLLEKQGEWRALCDVIQKQIAVADGGPDRARAAYRLGVVLETRVGDLPRAAKAYRDAIEAERDHAPSLAGLSRVLEATKAWEEAVAELRAQAERADDDQTVGESMLRAAEVLAERLGRTEEAVAALEEVRRRLDGERAALLRLGSLYEVTENWDRLARLYIERASRIEHPPARRTALISLAELVTERRVPGDHEPKKIYETVLGMKSDDRLALEGLDRLARDSLDPADTTSVATRRAELERDDAARAVEFVRAGDTLMQSDPAEAAGAFMRALELDPNSYVALRALGEIANVLDDPELRADVLRLEAQWTTDGDRAARLLVEAAAIARDELSNAEAAVTDLQRALDRGPDNAEAADDLDALLMGRGEVTELIDVLAKAARATPNKSRRLALWLRVAELQAGPPIDDVTAAIGSLERVVDLDPKATEPVLALAKLHTRNQSWKEAAAFYERVIKLGPNRAVAVESHLELARTWLQRLGDPERAGTHINALLDIQPGHREALLISVDLHIREAEYAQAEALATRLLRASTTGLERGQALAKLGALQLRNGERDKGRASLVEAVSEIGPRTEPGRRYRDEVGNAGATAEYAEALEKFLAAVEVDAAEDEDPGATYLELAKVHDTLGDVPRAVSALQRALRTREDDVDLRAALAERLTALGRYSEAEVQWRELISFDVSRASAWRGLARTLGHLQRPEEGRLALGPVVILGDASSEEVALAARGKTRPGLARPGSFGAEALQKISAGPVVEGRVIALLVAMHDVYGKVFAPDLGVYGLTVRDKIAPGTQHPLRAIVDRLAPAFGVERFDLYVHQVKHGLLVELGAVPSLVVPAYLGQLSEAQQVFMLSRALCHVARGVETAVRLGAEQLAVTLAATAKVFGHDQTRGLDEAVVDDMARRIGKAIPWIGKKSIEEAVTQYAAMPRLDTRAWLATLDKTATRAGAVLSGDVAGAADIIRRTDPHLHQLVGAELVAASAVIEDLMRFWLSSNAVELRAAAGMG